MFVVQIILSVYVILNLAIYLRDIRKMQKGKVGEFGIKLADYIESQSVWYKIKTVLAAAFLSFPIWLITTIKLNKMSEEEAYEVDKQLKDSVNKSLNLD